ncbi:hypothetical protein [Metaclostridioides mangenotii]|nr:hypothetical protein [Clostridioides mangenotii]
MPHSTLFHTSTSSVVMDIGELFKMTPYETLIGLAMVGISIVIQLA